MNLSVDAISDPRVREVYDLATRPSQLAIQQRRKELRDLNPRMDDSKARKCDPPSHKIAGPPQQKGQKGGTVSGNR